jgi:hypothetical protein
VLDSVDTGRAVVCHCSNVAFGLRKGAACSGVPVYLGDGCPYEDALLGNLDETAKLVASSYAGPATGG